MNASALVEHFFRHQYTKLVAVLTQRLGVEYIEIVEDAVQSALMSGLESWKIKGLPDNPSAWLFKVAYRNLLGDLRQRGRRNDILRQNADDLVAALAQEPEHFFSGELQDDMLRMLFVCCNPAIAQESQLVFALKTLCGFNIQEIAMRLFCSEANVYKRLSRARNYLKQFPAAGGELKADELSSRLSAVNKTLYLLFTEGYLSSHIEQAIRKELCEEAIRLTTMVAASHIGGIPETFALLALMYLHLARMDARQDDWGCLLLLEHQDRQRWNPYAIQMGLKWLQKSAQGEHFSRYHAEAGIAAEHCLAPSFQQTRWDRVVDGYILLEQCATSPLHRLNRAVAVAEWQGPEAGLKILNAFQPPTWLADSYLYKAVFADLNRRCGNAANAQEYYQQAVQLAPTSAVKKLFQQRFKIN